MEFSGALEDRIAIRELIDTYNSAVIHKDTQRWRSTWADRSSWLLMGNEVSGIDNIVTTWEAAMKQFSFVSFMGTPGSHKLGDQQGTGTVHVAETLVDLDKQQRNIFGLYNDEYVKNKHGKWQFARRDYQILYEYS